MGERYKDLVLPSSQPCRKDGDETEDKCDEEHAMARSLAQGNVVQARWGRDRFARPGHELVQVAPNMGAGGSHQSTSDQEWTQELHEIRRVVEFLVRRERKLDVKTDVAKGWKCWRRKNPS